MRKCKKIRKEIIFALIEERDFGKEIEEHLIECKECKDLFVYLRSINSASEAIKDKIEEEMEKIDWRRVEREIIDKVKEESRRPLPITPLTNLLSPKYLIPSMAILIILISVFIYKASIPKKRDLFSSSQLVFERMEKVSAKNEILKYFEDSGLLLSNLMEKGGMDKHSLEKSKELLLKKRFINQYLDDFPNAKRIASKIDLIFMEFQMEEEKDEIREIIDKDNLILKINLVKDELKEIGVL